MDFIIIFIAQYLFILSLIIAGIYFLKQNRLMQKEMFIFGIISLSIIYLMSIIAGHLYYDPRPFVIGNFTPLIPHAPDNGFPSDHALLLSAIASTFGYYNGRIALVLWVITFLVAFARVYAGIHHPIDVIGSMFISLFISSVVYISIKYVKSQKSI